jgi:hypothetical protein
MSKPTLKSLAEQVARLEGRIVELEKVNDASEILKRIARIERALIKAKLIRLPGADVVDATWMPDPTQNQQWQVHFEFFCEPCDETHSGSLNIPAHSRDGAEYLVTGLCGHTSRMRIWKKGATVFHPEAGPNGTPLVFGGL